MNTGPLALTRLFDILAVLSATGGGASLSEIVEALKCPKTSVYDLLKGLVGAGYVVQDAQGHYVLGPKSFVLARRILTRVDMSEIARPLLEALSEETGETALLGIRNPDGCTATYVQKRESDSPVRYTVALGEARELYCTSLGKVFLANDTPENLDRFLRTNKLVSKTRNTITDAKVLRAELVKVREKGVAYNFDERVESASSIAAPIISPSGEVCAVLVLAGPTPRMKKAVARFTTSVRRTALAISRSLGAVIA